MNNMPGIVRLNDKCTGHSCYPPRPCITASDNVFVDGKAVHREQDKWAMHACPNTPPHDGVLAKGSRTVYVNGKAIARIGDAISCGSKTQEGSQTVFAG